MRKTNGQGFEERLDRIREELEEKYGPPVINFAVRSIGALIKHLHDQPEMSGETQGEILYCIHRLLSWTADDQEKDL